MGKIVRFNYKIHVSSAVGKIEKMGKTVNAAKRILSVMHLIFNEMN